MKLKQKPCFSFLKDVEITALKKISSNNNAIKKDSKTLVITTFAQQEEICNLFSCGHCINITESAENGIYYRSECLPFIDKSYENVIFSAVFEKSFDIQFTVQELLRISNHKVFIFDKNANIYALNVQNAMNF